MSWKPEEEIDPNAKTCSHCNGKGRETRWLCKNGHVSYAFDSFENDPRIVRCPKCALEDLPNP